MAPGGMIVACGEETPTRPPGGHRIYCAARTTVPLLRRVKLL